MITIYNYYIPRLSTPLLYWMLLNGKQDIKKHDMFITIIPVIHFWCIFYANLIFLDHIWNILFRKLLKMISCTSQCDIMTISHHVNHATTVHRKQDDALYVSSSDIGWNRSHVARYTRQKVKHHNRLTMLFPTYLMLSYFTCSCVGSFKSLTLFTV